jgi:hypothetical protein
MGSKVSLEPAVFDFGLKHFSCREFGDSMFEQIVGISLPGYTVSQHQLENNSDVFSSIVKVTLSPVTERGGQ